jgi:hypothetical protein
LKETTIHDIVLRAKEFSSEKTSWHFHLLTPNCALNTNKKKHATILEGKGETYVTYSETRYLNEGRELVQLLHGTSIVKKKHQDLPVHDPKIKAILEQAKTWNEQGHAWHHHVLFPDCAYNKHPGKWCIIIEDPDGKKAVESVSKEEPKANQKAIELLFYQQKK